MLINKVYLLQKKVVEERLLIPYYTFVCQLGIIRVIDLLEYFLALHIF